MKLLATVLAALLLLIHPTTDAAQFCVADNKICVTTTPSDEDMFFEIRSQVRGYVALGFNAKTMDSADIIMAYPLNNKLQYDNRYSSGYSLPKINRVQSVAGDNSTRSTAPRIPNTLIYRFKRPLRATGDNTVVALKRGPMDLIWAYSDTPPTSPTSMRKHTEFGQLSVDLFSAESVSSATPALNRAKAVLVHGVLMVVAWGIVSPLAIFCARFMKSVMGEWWFRAHWGLFLLVLALSLSGFGLVVAAKEQSSGKHFNSVHTAMGLVFVILMVVQAALGQFINAKFDPHRRSIPWYDKAHWWLGRWVQMMSVAVVFLGIMEYTSDMKTLLYGGYAGLLALTVLVFVVAQMKLGQTHHEEPKVYAGYDGNYFPDISSPAPYARESKYSKESKYF